MAKVKKFGAFGGVFTPSILTILGVIMYLRLPWIVGQAGLYMTIGIILVAHIISVTTGMSVASIATDKRVKTGGTYYMISRSLGLPIGGTLGLALFVGLAFSVSLYLIGFSESFLGTLGWEISKSTIRLTGTIALIGVTTITFISTNLALKTQFFIMAAIALSLISILVGNHSFTPTQPLLSPIASSAPFILLFGIFFPAVTGFEAGVSMSGDLADPKRSIPFGTIAAIVIGLIVYIGLAIFFSFTVQSGQLVNNPKVLLEISYFPQIVLAGIWGATISSALGSILSAPRILQATALDRITPRFFGVGYGKENEPRNALLLAFAIAEVGILIGELDVIARIVSMFFITTYGFLNLSCAAESWASPDFRPEFRIPKTVSLIGAVTCFIVMIQLDLIAMIGATILLCGVFFYLKSKELTLETGDTWEGIWSSMVRTGLHKLNQRETHERNWRPNIILFSGGAARPHLIEIGKCFVDKRGLLSDFDLIEKSGRNILFRKAEQVVRDDLDDGVFARRVGCDDRFETMAFIAKYFGFSGIDPNTVLMGWGQHTQRPEEFVQVLKTVTDLDYNLMLLQFNETYGYGDYGSIDVWWRGAGNNISLMLALTRFLSESDRWGSAKLRFLTVTDQSAMTGRLFDNMRQLLIEYRLDGDVRVINNAVEKKPFTDILKAESSETDLVIIGLPNISAADAKSFIAKTSSVIEDIRSTLFISAGSFFKDVFISEETQQALRDTVIADAVLKAVDRPLNFGSIPSDLHAIIHFLDVRMKRVNAGVDDEFLQASFNVIQILPANIQDLIENSFATLEKKISEKDRQRNQRLIQRLQGDFLFQVQKAFTTLSQTTLTDLKKMLDDTVRRIDYQFPRLLGEIGPKVRVSCPLQTLLATDIRSFAFRRFRLRKKWMAKITGRPIRYRINLRQLLDVHISESYLPVIKEIFNLFALRLYMTIEHTHKLIDATVDCLGALAKQQLTDDMSPLEAVRVEKDQLIVLVDALKEQHRKSYQDALGVLSSETKKMMEAIVSDLRYPDVNFRIRKKKKRRSNWRNRIETQFGDLSAVWFDNYTHVLQLSMMNTKILSLKHRLRTIVGRTQRDVFLILQNSYIEKLKGIEQQLRRYQADVDSGAPSPVKITTLAKGNTSIALDLENMKNEVHTAIADLPESMEVIETHFLSLLTEQPFDPVDTRQLSLQRLVEYIMETEFIGPMADTGGETIALMNEAADTVKEVADLITINQAGLEGGQEVSTSVASDNVRSILTIGIERVGDVRQSFETMQKTLYDSFEKYLDNVFGKLTPYSIADSVSTLPHYFRTKQSKKVVSHFERFIISVRRHSEAFRLRLLYEHSLKKIAPAWNEAAVPSVSTVEEIIGFVESVSPRASVLSALPSYYKHLFLGKPAISRELWATRKDENTRIDKAIDRYRRDYKGALMVTGALDSGKTALCQYIAMKYFDSRNVFQVNPPFEGSTDVEVFKQRLRHTLQLKGDTSHMFKELPQNSVVIFNDIELWWQRSLDGFSVIDFLMSMIHHYSKTCFMVMNINSYAYHFLNCVRKIEHYFLDRIDCFPFDTRTIQNAVLSRHHLTGINFYYQGQSEETLSELRLAKLFIRITHESQGQIGSAFQRWMCYIRDVRKDGLLIDPIDPPENGVLQKLAMESLVLCGQLILHKRLTQKRLAGLTHLPLVELGHMLGALRRSGIVIDNVDGVYEVNGYIKPYLVKILIEKGILRR